MPAREGRVADVVESRSSHRIFHGVLLVEGGDHVVHSAAKIDGSPEKAAARLESAVAFRDSLFVHSFQKNPGHPIAAGREERREISGPFRST